jgi:hypothetical protein
VERKGRQRQRVRERERERERVLVYRNVLRREGRDLGDGMCFEVGIMVVMPLRRLANLEQMTMSNGGMWEEERINKSKMKWERAE